MDTDPGARARQFLGMYPQYADLWELAQADCTGELGTDLVTAEERFAEFLDNNDIIHFVWNGNMGIFNDSLLRKRFADGKEISGSQFVHLAEKYRLPQLDQSLKEFILENVCAIRRDRTVSLNDFPTPGKFWPLFVSLELALTRHRIRCPKCGEYELFWAESVSRRQFNHAGEASCPAGNGAMEGIVRKTLTCQVCGYSGESTHFMLPPGEIYSIRSEDKPEQIHHQWQFFRCPKCQYDAELYGDFSINMRFDGEGLPNPNDFDIAAVDLFSETTVLCDRCAYRGPLAEFEISNQTEQTA